MDTGEGKYGGVNRTAHKDTALLLARALGLTGQAEELFVAAARGNVPAADVLAAAEGAGRGPGLVTGSPYRGLSAFGERDAASSLAVKRPPRRCWNGCHVAWRARGSWWCRGCRGRASRRCCGRVAAAGPGRWAGGRAGSGVVAVGGVPPTRAPLDELALRVALLAGTDASAVRRGLEADPAGFALPARQAALARPLRRPGTGMTARPRAASPGAAPVAAGG